jgi:2-polyprenyl-3-methyl-5-hydroxy-6-metoxy-1,4-benzoquinol methylase
MLPRKRLAELMDDPTLDASSHAEALSGLARLNVLSMSASSIWAELRKFSHPESSQTVKVLDIATGGGDIPIQLYKYAQSAKRKFEFTGADISATAISLAQARARDENIPVSFIRLDALNQVIPSGFDVIITSLFTHHLDPSDVRKLFERMHESAGQLVIVNDLVRSSISLILVWLGTRILSRSKIVQYDGPVSVRAAYTINEMREMAQGAGLNNCSIHRYLYCRQLLVWKRSI